MKIRALFGKTKIEAEMNEEMRRHLELKTDQNIQAGMSPEEAHFAALREFGNVAKIQEVCREQRGWTWLENLWRDFRFSSRSLRRSAGFSAAVVITLMLCIGANTTIMSVLYGLILKPLPFRDAGQLVEIYNSEIKGGQAKKFTSVAQYLEFKANADLFEGFAAWRAWTFNIGEETDPMRGIGARATADIFAFLDLQPLLGRFYTMEECTPGQDRVLVLTQSFWEKNYQADPSVIGRVIRLSGEPWTIVGVAPRRLEAFNVDASILKPFEWSPQLAAPQARANLSAKLYARVKPGVTLGAARAQLDALENQFYTTVAPPSLRELVERTGQKIALGQVRAEQTKSVKTGLLMLQAGALFVLLLGCVNVASLMLARANARQAELALRQALGAGRGALARQLLSEGFLLAATGASLGLGMTWASLRLINTYTTAIIREVQAISLDSTVLGLTVLIIIVVALLIGLLPVLRLWRTNLLGTMQSGSRSASGGGGIRAMSGVLVTAQVALALMLLIGAGLLIRSFANVMAISPGFDASSVVHGRVAFNSSYANPMSAQAVQDQIMARMREIPGVESASYSSHMPVLGGFTQFTVPIRGSVMGKDDTFPTGFWLGVSPEFFSTMGIRLLEGRNFTTADTLPQARRVFIVDRHFAEQYFPGRSAVGETFAFGASEPEKAPMIIGVAEVAKLNGQEDSGVPFIYGAMGGGNAGGGFSIELRTTRSLEDILSIMRAKMRSVDSALPLYQTCILQMNLDSAAANRRGVMLLLGTFAGIALILSTVGIYGMLAYDVTQRTKEIGIRGAIGATRGQIVALILKQGLWKTGIGLVIGLGGAFYLNRYLSTLLFEVKSTDPLSFAGVTLVLLLVSLLASWLPARRAARIDPVIALRAE